MSIQPYLKAVVGGLVAGLTALATAMSDDTVTRTEWIGVAVAVVGALGVVYATPNRDPQQVESE